MNKKLMKTFAAAALALMVGCMAGCGGSGNSGSGTAAPSGSAKSGSALSGKITLAGSTSMEKLCEAMKESFMEKHPGVTVTAEYTGSSSGVESLLQGGVNIGNASRRLKEGEKKKGAVENVVAIDGIAVVVDKNNKVSDLTTEQLVSVYTGKITNWSKLGGSNDAIVVIGREAGSGTRGAFEELLKIESKCKYAQELDSTGAVLAKVSSTPGAIGYVSLDAVDKKVKSASLNGVAAAEKNIKSGDYKLARPFVMATKGEISQQNELVREWFAYLKSETGRKVITGVGLILPQ